MIESTTTVVITCDKCGREIAEGETWYQVSQAVGCSEFNGTAANIRPVSSTTLQLCTDDFPAWKKAGEEATPTASRVEAPLPPGAAIAEPPAQAPAA